MNQPDPEIVEGVLESPVAYPERQQALMLYGVNQPYQEVERHPIPLLTGDRELLVKTIAIGLNPIDWKAPDYNFGIPELPYLSGRELVGQIITAPKHASNLMRGELVIVISTDYRDLRKAAYQQYVLATDFNVARIPSNVSLQSAAATGVAFVAAAISLAVCAGIDFSSVADGPNLLNVVRSLDPSRLPEDIRQECLQGIKEDSRASEGDWLAIWGGSSTSAQIMLQLARLAGLRTISILDIKKHVTRRSFAHITVDNYDPQRAIEIVRAAADEHLRFGIDTVGKTTATHLLHCLGPQINTTSDSDPKQTATPPSTPPSLHSSRPIAAQLTRRSAHLIGLTGLPKTSPQQQTSFHSVPIKLFHEVPEVGEALMQWLERLLEQELLIPPEVVSVEHGFESINGALDRMRRGEISGGRVVVKVS